MSASEPADILVIYGHDHQTRNDVVEIIKDLGLKPVVLSKEPNLGSNTIIEKLERCTERAEFAVVILSPDDKMTIDDRTVC